MVIGEFLSFNIKMSGGKSLILSSRGVSPRRVNLSRGNRDKIETKKKQQGSYGTLKTWKVMENQNFKIQAWKMSKISVGHGKSWKIRIPSGSANNCISIFFAHIFKFLGVTNEAEKYRKNCIYDTHNLNLS